MNIFNRKELYGTFSLKSKNSIVEKLNNNSIRYDVKVINRNSPSAFSDSRHYTGTLGQNMDLTYEYIIYVHKNDFSKAITFINRI